MQDYTRKISLVGGLIILSTALVGVLGGFAVLFPQVQEHLHKNLQRSLEIRDQEFQHNINEAWLESSIFASQPLLNEAVQALGTLPDHHQVEQERIRRIADSAMHLGFSAVLFRNKAGREIARSGSFTQAPDLDVILHTSTPSHLLWKDGFILRTQTNIVWQNRVIGTLDTERPLQMAGIHKQIYLGGTTDYAICAPATETTMNCFPFRSTHGKVLLNLPNQVDRQPIPMSYALANKTGLIHTRDYRGQEVIAAYAPIGTLGLGSVLKIDAKELYQPISSKYASLLVLLLFLVAIGILLLYKQVLPLVRRMALEIDEREKTNTQLQESEERFKTIANATFEGLCISQDGVILDTNEQLPRILGYEGNELIGHDISELMAPEYRDMVMPGIREGKEQVRELHLLKKDGTRIIAEAHGRNIQRLGQPLRLTTFRDITERLKTESETRIAATAFETQEGMLVTDANANILRVNKAFTNITGYTAEEVFGKNPRLLSSGRQNKDFYVQMWGSINSRGTWEGEIWNRRKNGEIYPEWLSITAVKNESGKVMNYVASMSDITPRKRAQEEIHRLAFYDSLTDLPNRRLLLERLHQALAYNKRNLRHGALLFIDLDNFKIINDTLGHTMGDRLLREVADRLVGCIREGDTVARLGGDEFVVMLGDLDKQKFEASEQAKTVADKVMESIRRRYNLGPHDSECTPSVGITLFSGHNQTAEEILRQADIAMYEAKKSGRNTVRFFDHEMHMAITERAHLEAELRKALDEDQFELYYQVQMSDLGKTVGAETLIRWHHPVRGIIPPGDFISILEESNLIIPVGVWILETACAQLKQWESHPVGARMTLSVNVSARQFHQPEFVQQVKQAILRHQLNPGRLKLELTESVLLQDIEGTIRSIQQLSDLGVLLSLDDFGTGYSSLKYLKLLPLDQLKIDQSFVRDITTDLSDLAIVRTIVAIADSLGLDIIAEGVESEEQKKQLLRSGCTYFQGYLYGKPMPIGEFEEKNLIST